MHREASFLATLTAGAGALLLAALPLADVADADDGQPTEARDLAGRMNQLGSETLRTVTGTRGEKSVVVSPYGLGSTLHLLLLGAKGSAEESLQAKLLPSSVVVGKQDTGLITLKQNLLGASREKLKLMVSSAVFVPSFITAAAPSRRFVARARAAFDAPVESLDFKNATALERINAWAKEATRGLVPRVLDKLDADARFVLANTVYFNGAWDSAFDPERTARAPFTHVDGSSRDAAIMDATMQVGFAEVGNLRAAWLPYDGNEIAMLVVAPAEGQPPTATVDALKQKSISELMGAAREGRRTASVHVRLPRFRAESSLDLSDTLSGLGLAPALSALGNYAAINKSKGGPLLVTQRAVLEVTEAGAKAAAATAVTRGRSLALAATLSADRPFAFAIIHEPTQAILFAGYIADPGDDPSSEMAERGSR